ncbi:MAG TPA: ABC-type transport auxiliary lipoprotein family protein [Kofleriaceae bacterium]|nr:ABC-type transport auxiliary lipoprotein family protein [Kofleriaceae bacterium]
MRCWLAGIVFVAGCALTSKGEPRELRYFTIETSNAAGAPAAGAGCGQVRLGRIIAGTYLERAIERRISPVELVPYDTLRWSEPPADYVRRAVTKAVFAHGIDQAVAGTAPVLELEVVAFEEIARGGGRVELRYQLRDDHRVISRGAVSAERAARGAGIDATVVAIGEALAAASDDLAVRLGAASCPSG